MQCVFNVLIVVVCSKSFINQVCRMCEKEHKLLILDAGQYYLMTFNGSLINQIFITSLAFLFGTVPMFRSRVSSSINSENMEYIMCYDI